MVLFDLIMALKGPTYRLGTLMHMGPGFLPTVLGVILIFLGILVAATATTGPSAPYDERIPPEPSAVVGLVSRRKDWDQNSAGPQRELPASSQYPRPI